MIYYTSDLHFGCQNKFEGRNLDTDKSIIRNWNNRVTNGDTVYILGDIGKEGKNEENEYLCQCLSVLKGRKVLIQGNHDKLQDLRIRQQFSETYSYKEVVDVVGKKTYKVVLCHYPIIVLGMDSIEETFISMVTCIATMKEKVFQNSSKM